MEIKFCKVGQPIVWKTSTENYLECSKHKCKMVYKDMCLFVSAVDSSEQLVIPIGNIAFLQVKEEKKAKKDTSEPA